MEAEPKKKMIVSDVKKRTRAWNPVAYTALDKPLLGLELYIQILGWKREETGNRRYRSFISFQHLFTPVGPEVEPNEYVRTVMDLAGIIPVPGTSTVLR